MDFTQRLHKFFFPNASSDVSNRLIERERQDTGTSLSNVFPLGTSALTAPINRRLIEDAVRQLRETDYSRYAWSQLSERAFRELHTQSEFRTHKSRIMADGFTLINKRTGNPAPFIKRDLFEYKHWMITILDEWLKHKLFGVSLLEFQYDTEGRIVNVNNSERAFLDTVNKLARVPEVEKTNHDDVSFFRNYSTFDEYPYKYLEILYENNPYATGDLLNILKVAEGKLAAFGGWMCFNDSQSPPILIWNHDRNNEKRMNQEIINIDSTSAVRLWRIGKEEKLSRLEIEEPNMHVSFRDIIDQIDSEISKSINGYSLNTQKTAPGSSSEVQERNVNSFANTARYTFISWAEGFLMPFLASINGGVNPYNDLSNYRLDVIPSEIVEENETNQRTDAPSAEDKKSGNPNRN